MARTFTTVVAVKNDSPKGPVTVNERIPAGSNPKSTWTDAMASKWKVSWAM